MEEFHRFSNTIGLRLNLKKYKLYFGGILDHEQQITIATTGFAVRTLPFMYVGVPLSSKRLPIM